jgi:hypothetical protein
VAKNHFNNQTMTDKTTAELLAESRELRAEEPSLEGDTPTFECGEPGCDDEFNTEIAREKHVAFDHEARRIEIDNYPRAPSER